MVDGGFQEAGGGARQVRPCAAVVDPAFDLLRRLAGDVGDRAGSPTPGCDRLGRPAWCVRGAGVAGRRWPGRDARLQLPAAPRVRPGARRAADVNPSADPPRVARGSVAAGRSSASYRASRAAPGPRPASHAGDRRDSRRPSGGRQARPEVRAGRLGRADRRPRNRSRRGGPPSGPPPRTGRDRGTRRLPRC